MKADFWDTQLLELVDSIYKNLSKEVKIKGKLGEMITISKMRNLYLK